MNPKTNTEEGGMRRTSASRIERAALGLLLLKRWVAEPAESKIESARDEAQSRSGATTRRSQQDGLKAKPQHLTSSRASDSGTNKGKKPIVDSTDSTQTHARTSGAALSRSQSPPRQSGSATSPLLYSPSPAHTAPPPGRNPSEQSASPRSRPTQLARPAEQAVTDCNKPRTRASNWRCSLVGYAGTARHAECEDSVKDVGGWPAGFDDACAATQRSKRSKIVHGEERRCGSLNKICDHAQQKHGYKDSEGSRIRDDSTGTLICEHGRQKHRCKDCESGSAIGQPEESKRVGPDKNAGRAARGKDSSICNHGRQRQHCKDCSGSQVASTDDKLKNSQRRDSKGRLLCEHGRQKRYCKDCGGSAICEHRRLKHQCKDCGGSGICEHGKRRNRCKDCGGSAFCMHGKYKDVCRACGGSQICEHGRIKRLCKDCGGSGICKHGKQKRYCKPCGGSAVCKPHGKAGKLE